MSLESLEELLQFQLRQLYDVQSEIIDAFPRMISAASSSELKAAFSRHQEITRRQKDRLDQIFHKLGREPESVTCEGVRGILEDATMFVNSRGDNVVRDAALIAAVQQMEHYQTASYGTARTFAQVLGWNDIADILQQTLDEAKAVDRELTTIATTSVNPQAV